MIYLDNAATTKPCRQAIEAFTKNAEEAWGNPSSLHKLGIAAEQRMESSRQIIAKALGADTKQILFTSGGTEANNMAIQSAVLRAKRKGRRIVASAYEHSSVHQKLMALEKEGFEVVWIAPEKSGEVDIAGFLEQVNEDTILAVLMLVNNEVGGLNDVGGLTRRLRKRYPDVLVHCDAVAAFGKISINAVKLGVDTLTVSAHKIHGFKGCGALYCKDPQRCRGLLIGGEQERGIRPGTQNTAGIAAFGAACERSIAQLQQNWEKVSQLKEYLCKRLEELPFVQINCCNSFPYTVNCSVEKIRSEILLHFLESKEIYISSGSACAKGAKTHVLRAMGFDDRVVDSSVRISFCEDNTIEEIDALIAALQEAKDTLHTA